MEPFRRRRLFVSCLLLCTTVLRQGSATLTITQGRIIPTPVFTLTTIPVVGIATVELHTDPSLQPTYYFECMTSLNDGSGLTWTRQSESKAQEFPTSVPGASRLRLDATGISQSDLDVYICSDTLSYDNVSLKITDSNPAIMAVTESVQLLLGQTAEMEVYVSGYPIPTESDITWRYPNSTVITSNDAGVTFQDSKRKLILTNVQSNQAGTYQCTVALSQIEALASVNIQLGIKVPPSITTQPQVTVDTTEWSEVKLTCAASGIPIPQIEWEREGGVPLPPDTSNTTTTIGNTATNQLVLNMVRYDDRGRYRCIANNTHTTLAISEYADVRVTPALDIRVGDETAMPQTVNELYVAQEESKVILECFGTGNLVWTSSTGIEIEFDESENTYQSYDQTRDALELTIKNFTSLTTDVYTCTTDLTDALNNPITVSVLITSSNPAVVIKSRNQYVLAGSSTTIQARVYASPYDMADVTWYLEDRLIDDANDNQYTTSSEGDIYRLEVNSVSESELGNYTVVVTLNGMSATDSVRLRFPEPPMATITPSMVTVNEGGELRLFCEARGSGELTVSWTMVDGSPLPLGVQENGNEILIASATGSHPGTYVCTVTNLAGTNHDEVIVNVFYRPTVIINYNQLTSMSGQPLYLGFDDGAMGPTILCSADGYLPPTLAWVQENGRGLPHGIIQSTQQNGDVELRWQREMEFTDSGSYVCKASNQNGNSSATLQVLVQIDPSITSIYPFSSDIRPDSQTFSYTVPLSYVGSTIVCVASGWPAPEVEWWKDGQPIPASDGVISEMVSMSSTVSAKLTWTRYFQNSDSGIYECVVRKPNTVVPLMSQIVWLNARNSTGNEPSMACSTDQQSIFFQIRVLGTNCQSVETVNEFQNELLSILTSECGCDVSRNELVVLGSPQCSSKVDGAVVFRGQIETDSQARTEEIFCSILSWQQRSPLIRINNQFRAVDSSCSLEASSSITAEECVAPSPDSLGMREIAIIVAVPVVLILLLFIVLVSIFLTCCYYRKRKRNTRVDDHTYSRTDIFVGSSRNGTSKSTSAGAYSTLNLETRDSPLHFQETTVTTFNHLQNDSSQNLITSEGTDGSLHSLSKLRMPTNYEIPFSSQENLASSAEDSTPSFQATSRHTSGTSGYNSSSPIEQAPCSNSHDMEDSRSATNPRYTSNDYEDTLSPNSTSSLSDNLSPSGVHPQRSAPSARVTAASFQRTHKASGNQSPSGSAGSSSPHIMKQALMVQFQSTDNVTGTRSPDSESPPPYTVLSTCESTVRSDSSMTYNRVYEGAEHHQHPWYHDEPLANSNGAPLRHSPSTGRNAITQRIQPYAMIHNEHIPYHPSSPNISSTTIPRQSRDRQESGLISSLGAATSSTLC